MVKQAPTNGLLQVIRLARDHLGLADLETPTEEGGRLVVHVGDALAPEASAEGGFAGLEALLNSSLIELKLMVGSGDGERIAYYLSSCHFCTPAYDKS
jgi:hypothetical protein